MNEHITISKRAARAGMAVIASILLISGAAWRGLAADEHPAAHAATVSTPIQHAVAASRDSYADVVDVVAPAVVTIRTEGKAKVSPTQFQMPDDDFFQQFFGRNFRGEGQGRGLQPRTFRQRALGSGVMVTTDGYLLTNYHVVDGADEIKVDFQDGRTLNAKVIGTDKPSDLALLKVNGSDFKAIALGNSDNVKVGDVVLAVGNPLGVGETVTMGIISAKNRSTSVDGSYEDFLQTDAPINHGNSGGALVNTKGELVGINSQILSSNDGNIGIGFAIPANMAKNVMEQLRTKGKVTRAQLGVTVQTVSSDMAQSLGLKNPGGVIVSSVTSGSAADRAGIKQGDVITSFDGQPVHDMNMLRNRVAAAGPGSNADLTIVRDGSEKHMTVKLDELTADHLARNGGDEGDNSGDKSALGVAIQPSDKGLVVEDVDPNGRAADAGIQQGDIIKSVNRTPVKSIDDLRSALKKTTDKPALLLIQRQDAQIFVTVRPANG
ncbi:MAG TPA: DegQ family serine endoprotease [Vicinamibacterales bacterium]|nr:DegQ family serine endoprotease [Vicinamibacterales bacterium]